MSKELSTFEFGGRSVTVLGTKDEPLFLAKEIAEILGYSETSAMVRYLDEDEKGTCQFDSPSGKQQFVTITESGLYSAVLRRQDTFPEAKAFRKWVTSEILPSIRKHGAYATPATAEAMLNDPDVMIKVLTALKEERIAKINAQLDAKEAQKRALEAKESESKALEARDAAAAKEKQAMSLVGIITEAPSEDNLILREVSKKFQSMGWDCNESKLRASLVKAGVLMNGSRGITATSKAISAGLCVVGNKLGDKVVKNNMTGWSGEVLTPRFTAKGVMVVGKNLPKFGFKRETQTIEFMDLELPEE